jgi:hypothetical protein
MNYKELLQDEDALSQLTLDEIKQLRNRLYVRQEQLKPRPPKFHILDNPDNIKVSERTYVDENHIPRIEYVISINQEALQDHKVLWKDYYVSAIGVTPENYDERIKQDFFGIINEKFHLFYYNEEE